MNLGYRLERRLYSPRIKELSNQVSAASPADLFKPRQHASSDRSHCTEDSCHCFGFEVSGFWVGGLGCMWHLGH